MPESELEQALRNFEQVATRVRDGKVRQLWTFEFQDKRYFLYFYFRRPIWARLWLGGSALVRFIHLQAMQRAGIASPRAVAHLSGFRIGNVIGDAAIVEALPNAMQLDVYLRDALVRGVPIVDPNGISRQMVDIVHEVGRAKFGHPDLGLHSFLISEGRLHFHDVERLRGGGLRLDDVLALAHNVAPFATRAQLLRGWDTLNPDTMPPARNPLDRRLWNRVSRRSRREGLEVGAINAGAWKGYFTRTSRFAQPWSIASRLDLTRRDWESAWPTLLARIEGDQLTPLKRDASGDVLSGELTVGGKPISIIVKRPFRKSWSRYLLDLIRPSRAERTWIKAWMLIARGIPCEWPMLLMQRKTLGYATDGIIVFERVPGEPLYRVELDAMNPHDRQMLFRRAGGTLRAVERTGLMQYDSKSTNWIVHHDVAHGPVPIMIDLDGIRPLSFFLQGWSIQRLLRAMKLHPQYTPADSLELCRGYAPYAGRFEPEKSQAKPK